MNNISVKTFSDIETCHRLWEEFSPKESIFDLWDFRFPFYEVFKYELHFVLLSSDGEKIGLLPLWYNSDFKKYFWFGDTGDGYNWQEDNSFWVKDEKYIAELLKNCPRPAVLNSIRKKRYEHLSSAIPFIKGDPKHILNLGNFQSSEDYLMSIPNKTRSNLRCDKNKIEKMDPEIFVDRFSDFETLASYSVSGKGNSYFNDKKLVKTFKEILENGKRSESYKSRMLSVEINGFVAGVDTVLLYNGIYYSMLCGNRVSDFPGIGNYLTLLDIDDAIRLRMNMIDFSESTENSYKDKLFTRIEQYACVLDN
jgi:hypothetical protein